MTYLRRNNGGRFTDNDPDRIPCSVVAPVLKKAFDNWVFWRTVKRGQGSQHMEPSSGTHIVADLLAAEHGGNPETWAKRIRDITSENYQTCSLNVVDHILVTMGQHQLWYLPPLSDYYFSPATLAAA